MTVSRGNRSFFWNTLPAVLWPILIFGASSIPAEEIPHSQIFYYDKLLHAGVFGVFCFLMFRALTLKTPPVSEGKAMLYSVLATILYGVTDELHQFFVPGRTPEIYDLAADGAGALICISILYIVRRIRRPSPPH